MKLRLAAAALCAAGIAMPAWADDADDIRATLEKAEAAYNNCDAAALGSLTHAEFFGLNPDGTLSEGNDMSGMKEACEKGAKYDFNIQATKVHAGNGWGVVTGTNNGTYTPPGGEAQKVNSRFTVVVVKDGGVWKSLHLHSSPIQQATQ